MKTFLMAALAAFALGAGAVGCDSEPTEAVLEKCKKESKQTQCLTCCELEGWEKGSVSTGECECRRDD